MVSTAIGLAIGSLILISSILLFVSLWSTYFSTYISAVKAYAEKASYLSKAGLKITTILVKKRQIVITLKNTGSVPIRIGSNYTFILVKCLNENRQVVKVFHFHVGMKGVAASSPILDPGEKAHIVVKKRLNIAQSCSYLEIIVECSEGVRAVKTVSTQ